MVTAKLRPIFLFAAMASALALVGCAADANDTEAAELASSELAGDESTRDASSTTTTTAAALPATEGLALSVHTTLGIPEDATPEDPVHALIVKRQYVTSYDSTRKNPRWTSWEVTPAWLGPADRSNNWKQDPDLATFIPQPVNSDYTNSGFQRGHICPSADRTKNDTDNQATFVFTNVVPQTAESNTAVWLSLENEERTLAKQTNSHVFVIAGSIYASDRRIGNGVAVPTSMFKVVVVLKGANPVPADVTEQTRVIAVEVPNTTSVSGNYRRYRTSLESLEQKTGFHLLSDVQPAVHAALAPQVDSL